MAEELSQQLAQQAFFSGLEPEHLNFLAAHAQVRQLQNDQILFRHGDPARTFYLVDSGGIVLEIPAISGPTLEVQQLAAGSVLGWSWLIAPYRWSFNARTLETTTVVEFDGEAILDRCERDPTFGYPLLKRFSGLMSERLEAARTRMMEEWNPPGFA